jgi:hypothetical protein
MGGIDVQLGKVVALVQHAAVCKASGEVGIVKNTYLETELQTFIDDDIHVMPPLFAYIIGMGAGFKTYGADAALVNLLQHGTQGSFVFSVKPEEGKDMVILHIIMPPHELFDLIIS